MTLSCSEKPSLRTRVSFEAAVAQLGGSRPVPHERRGLASTGGESGRRRRARVLGTYSDWIVLRTFTHRLVEQFVAHAGCPIINGLSDQGHPCQALSDVLTMQETLGSLPGRQSCSSVTPTMWHGRSLWPARCRA